ncbi:MAG TPA: M81 family metallopeptidase [Bryobacterales bacterium]|nr:M81 family metallopeptidase [Bryobacterales bacterium]
MADSSKKPLVAIGGIQHESNSFSAAKTTVADFERNSLTRDSDILKAWGDGKHEVSGMIQGAAELVFDLYPTLFGIATPSGPVTAEAFEALTGELVERIRAAPPLDGMLLALHGAMFCESYPHGDAEIVRRVREALPAGLPLVVSHDFHANVAPDLVEHCDALVIYKTNPHVDQYERGHKAAEIIAKAMRGEARPVQAIEKPDLFYNIRFQNTSLEPLAPITEETRRLERDPKILSASVCCGYQYADAPAMGPSVVVVTDGDEALARSEAKRLSKMLWDIRDKLILDVPDAAEAVRQSIAGDGFPVVLVEMGDNIGGGSAADSTFVLSELLKQNAQGWAEAVCDPEAVQAAIKAGIGGVFSGLVGGKTDDLHGEPVQIEGRVKCLHDGKFVETEIRHGGWKYQDQGTTAVIEVAGSTRDLPNLLLLTTLRLPPFSLHQLTSCGVYPERQKILVVKAAIAYRAAYGPIAKRIIEVDTGGLTAINPARFNYQNVRRPLHGLD